MLDFVAAHAPESAPGAAAGAVAAPRAPGAKRFRVHYLVSGLARAALPAAGSGAVAGVPPAFADEPQRPLIVAVVPAEKLAGACASARARGRAHAHAHTLSRTRLCALTLLF